MSPYMKRIIKEHFAFLLKAVIALKHINSRRKIRKLLKESHDVSVEFGAGAKRGVRGWITVDMANTCDIFWDLRKGIPFPKDSIKTIYSSHFLEHLTYQQGQRFLDECKRTLSPNGKFVICVPNARLYLEAYVKGRSLDAKTFFGWKSAYNGTTSIDMVNYTAYMDGEHKYMFDEDNLLFILRAKGFKNVALRPFDAELDMIERDFESLYAEATK